MDRSLITSLITSAIGAVIGFALSQALNLWSWWKRPRLVIEELDRALILSHGAEHSGQMVMENYYAFVVRNKGRSIATGVRFQILKISFRRKTETKYVELSDIALNLACWAGSNGKGSEEITLVPNAAATVGLAGWRDDTTLHPLTTNVFDYYEEMTAAADEFLFEVVTFDDRGGYATKTITIIPEP